MRYPRNSVQEIHIAVLGLNGSGKTALTVKFLTRRFITEYDPNLEDTYCKHAMIHGREFMIWVMDTIDSPEKDASRFLPWADIFMVVYSITSIESLNYAKRMLALIGNHPHTFCERPHTTVLLGNKTDLERYRQVSKVQATGLASEYGAEFFELNCTEEFAPVKTIFNHAVSCAISQRLSSKILSRSPSPKYASDSETNVYSTSTSTRLQSEPRSLELSKSPVNKTFYSRRSKSPAAKLHDSINKHDSNVSSPLPPLPPNAQSKKSSPGLKLLKLFQN